MYSPPTFHIDQDDEVTAFIQAHPFAMLAVNGPDGPCLAHVPVLLQAEKHGAYSIIAHVARANPFWQVAADGPVSCVAAFRGADGYIRPGYYPSKAETGRVVPTWNYEAAEARGQMTVETDPGRMDRFLEPITQMMELGRPQPWAMSDAPEDYLDRMRRAVVGVWIEVSALSGTRKLSQNKDAVERDAVVAALASEADPAARRLAEVMSEPAGDRS